ncbi:MAG: Uma2 family endonuclease [Oscillatoriales cyanobacterium]|uniref:Uma2 family endonuclease n=2 Tax=Microcoleaceae TaxID=1892252 RepID=A0A2G4EZ95_9CYAN|nr:Uma2 family endonuclease [Tychonema bourrellyi]MDQ2100739.1 Uma2 family endonuclease [Tychonema bourrellyi B0820]TAD93717.1 MAG: Uma2 family endonuclease [Oscillatoriales cyanobacterium]PHX54820.1 Uma2 family endonuclease [Tychonema bourrellyi FEM_GT703]TAE03318.1 MAG: Uma2 family endonuclease [Oscillatoriales cyanobacterium]TAF06701.1 MAG: Uma2 family endonuclease [Oscillatoriales cyanobacterium]
MNVYTLAKSTSPETEQDGCMMFYGVSWEQFEAIEAAFKDLKRVKFFYLDRILQIMTVSPEHEIIKKTLCMLLEAYMRANGIRFYGKGGPTLGNRELGGRKEPDDSYDIGTEKTVPDIAIEVVITSGGIDTLELYKRLGIREVWFWQNSQLSLYNLRGENYEQITRSTFLPNLDLELLLRCANMPDQYDAVTELLANISPV